MAGDKILVFGATGPAGICLLRELLHRKLPTLAYCRNPTKVPEDVASNSLLEVAKGDMTQHDAISRAVAKSRVVISLLGPSSTRQPKNTEFADYYRTVVPFMKEHGVHRILALGTTAMYRTDDQTSISRAVMSTLIKVVANGAHHNILAIQEYWETLTDNHMEWTVFRVGNLAGTSDALAWSVDREAYKAFEGPVGAPGYTSGINRSILARWLVDVAISDPARWSRQMPAVSKPAK
ncbi:hypothetical protein FOXYS1_9296 [Fusarium oxysporum]|uniref:NAD(P)-binding domain-containing protein n=1 Tax=Fusarium oxysporum TaxID=5507 RepID=A0A8H5A8E3_FUSOX|nr:hypothetical protein FOXYS1_9296 [Fusarium oxysporum]